MTNSELCNIFLSRIRDKLCLKNYLPHNDIENIAGQHRTFVFKIKRLIQGKLCLLYFSYVVYKKLPQMSLCGREG